MLILSGCAIVSRLRIDHHGGSRRCPYPQRSLGTGLQPHLSRAASIKLYFLLKGLFLIAKGYFAAGEPFVAFNQTVNFSDAEAIHARSQRMSSPVLAR